MKKVRLDVHEEGIRASDAAAWDTLLSHQKRATPFLRHAYLDAMTASGSATPETGWTPRAFTLWESDAGGTETLVAACMLYLKTHSFGEYVFDHAWAHAYRQHRVPYYPKAVIAPPFTPVPGSRLIARDASSRQELLQAVLDWCAMQGISSLHVLFADETDIVACTRAGMMVRHNVQFHWTNRAGTAYTHFDDFLASLSQDKRKKIRQERRKVADAGVTFRWMRGKAISDQDWEFFYRCYERTYLEHGNAPYLHRDFFVRMAAAMPENWLLFVGEREGRPIASSLIGLHDEATGTTCERVAYGRYWGALERVDCLHFEACYYQPLNWCIQHGFARFEGGAQGEHKMARALLPSPTCSAHWLAHPGFARAVQEFLEREGQGVARYVHELEQHNPFKTSP